MPLLERVRVEVYLPDCRYLSMNPPDKWRNVFAEDVPIRSVEEDIYSVLPDSSQIHLYDRRAASYDLVVGTSLYNRVMWGASLHDYISFGRQAVASNSDGVILDAGCGSLLFTAQGYLECDRSIIAFDQSLPMLRRARARLIKFAGSVPERFLLLQADLSALPFRPAICRTAVCMNVLHHFADAKCLLANLKKLLIGGGHLYLTSLVKSDRRIGDLYLDVLYRWGGFVRPRTGTELKTLLDDAVGQGLSYRIQGNMAYTTAETLLNDLQTNNSFNRTHN